MERVSIVKQITGGSIFYIFYPEPFFWKSCLTNNEIPQ